MMGLCAGIDMNAQGAVIRDHAEILACARKISGHHPAMAAPGQDRQDDAGGRTIGVCECDDAHATAASLGPPMCNLNVQLPHPVGRPGCRAVPKAGMWRHVGETLARWSNMAKRLEK